MYSSHTDTRLNHPVFSCLTFWRMVHHALCIALERPCSVNEHLWPRTPTALMPPLAFIKDRVKCCYDDFIAREQCERSLVPGLEAVLTDVSELLAS